MSRNIFKIYDGRNYFLQWDIDQKLIVLDSTIEEVHFSNKYMTHAIPKDVVTDKDGLRVCHIPDSLLTVPKTFTASAYVTDDNGTKIMRSVKYAVRPRPIPADYIVSEDFKLDDFDERLDTFEDIVENGCLLQKFDTIEEARKWAKDTRKLGSVITVKVDSKWFAYVVDDDFSIYPIYNGDEEALISDIVELKNLVGDMPVINRIENVIENLDLPSKYDAKGAAQTVQNNLDEFKTSNERTIYNIMVATNDAQDDVDDLAEKVGKVPANKTVVQMIDDVKTSVNNYDDSEIRSLLDKNAMDINEIVQDYLTSVDKMELSDALKLKADKNIVDDIADKIGAVPVDKTVAQMIEDLQLSSGNFDDAELRSLIEGNESAINDIAKDYLKAIDKNELSAAIALKADKSVVNNIVADYLKKSDKTELSNMITQKADKSVVDNIISDYIKSADKSELVAAIDLKADKTIVDNIAADYLKSADKTKLEDSITSEANARKAADKDLGNRLVEVEAFFKLADGEQLDDALDTLVEIQDYITNEGAAADQMVLDIGKNADAIAKEVANREAADAALSGRIDNIHTHSNKSTLDKVSSEKVAAWDSIEENAKLYTDELVDNVVKSIADIQNGALINSFSAIEFIVNDLGESINDEIGARKSDSKALSDKIDNIHTHDNKSVLDNISAENVAAWNSISADMREAISEIDTELDGKLEYTDDIAYEDIILPIPGNWVDVAYGNGKFVAIESDSNQVVYSEDGINWVKPVINISVYWNRVTYGNGKFVAISHSNKAAYSEDGINWTATTLPEYANWYSVTYGNGKFVAISTLWNVSAYSYDGIKWARSTLPQSESWKSVTYGNGKFVAIANNTSIAAYSEDGISWAATSITESNWQSVTYGNGKFVVIANDSSISAYSEDGITWNETRIVRADWKSVTHGSDKFVALSNTNDVFAYSEDGIVWNEYYPSDDIVKAANWNSVIYGNGKFVAVGNNSSVAIYSEDGINWIKSKNMQKSGSWASISYGNGKFISVCSSSDVAAYSEDGINWYETNMPKSTTWKATSYGNGKFVAVGSSAAAYSIDGATWVETTIPEVNWGSVTYCNGKFVAVATGSSIAAHSEDGINWIEAPMPGSRGFKLVIYRHGRFVAVGAIYSKSAYSDDGINWVDMTMISTSIDWQSVTYGNGKFVATSNSSIAAYSEDGINWTETAMPKSADWKHTSYVNDKFISFSKGSVAHSEDGINWTENPMPDFASWISSAYGNGKIIAVPAGHYNAICSEDGINWSTQGSVKVHAIRQDNKDVTEDTANAIRQYLNTDLTAAQLNALTILLEGV